MKINLLPEVLKIANADRCKRPLESYVNHCVLQCHGNCSETKILKEITEWLDHVIEACHSTKKHEPEYCVVKHKLESIVKKYREKK